MDWGAQALHEVIGFFGLGALLELVAADGYRALLSAEGAKALLYPVIPFLLVYELARALVQRRFKLEDYRVPFLTLVANRLIGALLSFGMVAACIALFQPYAPFQAEPSWYGLIYGYVVWEFAHFVYHYLAHKVRLLWCLHSTHHAPTAMNLSVNYAHLFLEAPYADIVRTTICILAGVSPPLLLLIMFIDGFWGQFIHLGEHALRDGRLGRLHRWVLTPAHHRVHHARNPLYMDTNFCNLLNIWDRAFGTYQPQREDISIEYGITRPMWPGSFLDAYLGEFVALARDVIAAPGLGNKLRYLLMPPGWSHDGRYKTALESKRDWLAQRQEAA
ncbi:sterol desaturase family protein [Lysobacter firmicutimachus]|uniref:Sterol desaturase family protein n=1 Tax=Lysobacter firmicutimachus TaxID=1792846 RepID=A0ABU8D7B9_9GAMM